MSRPRRILVTVLNEAGKSHFADALHRLRPDLVLVSFDALRLTQGWRKRPQAEIDAACAAVVGQEARILNAGPSVLQRALARADVVVWLDPPGTRRAIGGAGAA